MSEERFIDLESRLAQLDHLLQELNTVVTDQQARLMKLEEINRYVVERVRSIGEVLPAAEGGDERPPHY